MRKTVICGGILSIFLIIIILLTGAAISLPVCAQEITCTVNYYWDDGLYSSIGNIEVGSEIKNAMEVEDIGEGYEPQWRLRGKIVVFPYTVKEEDLEDGILKFYGTAVERKLTLTIIGSGDEKEEITFAYGEAPELPTRVFNNTVTEWYVDPDFSEIYSLGNQAEDFTLYPKFKDRVITVSVDGREIKVSYGDEIPPLDNTDTHIFKHFTDGNGKVYNNKITAPINLYPVYERKSYRVDIAGGGKVFVKVGEFLTLEMLSEYGERFYFGDNSEDDVNFPYGINDDIIITAREITPEPVPEPEKLRYDVSVVCEHATFSVDISYYPNDIVYFQINDVSSGYRLESVLISCNGEMVVSEREDMLVTFVMPEGAVKILVTFAEINIETNTDTDTDAVVKKGLEKKEIIAVAVVGAGIAAAAAITIILKLKKRH